MFLLHILSVTGSRHCQNTSHVTALFLVHTKEEGTCTLARTVSGSKPVVHGLPCLGVSFKNILKYHWYQEICVRFLQNEMLFSYSLDPLHWTSECGTAISLKESEFFLTSVSYTIVLKSHTHKHTNETLWGIASEFLRRLNQKLFCFLEDNFVIEHTIKFLW